MAESLAAMNGGRPSHLEGDVGLFSAYIMGEARFGPVLLDRLGVAKHPLGPSVLFALDAVRQDDFESASTIFRHLATDAQLLPALDRILQYLYKVTTAFTYGKLLEACSQAVVEVIGRHLATDAGQRLVLEFFLYFGKFKEAEQVLAALPATAVPDYRAELQRARLRLELFTPRKRFSFCLLTWNRADLLDRCLTDLKAKAASQDYEIVVGVNASTDHTAQVLAKHGIQNVLWNTRNDSIDYYRAVFDAAAGEYIVEIDDNVVEFPIGFDRLLEDHLQAFPDFGYIGIQPTRLSLSTGQEESMVIADYGEAHAGDLTLHLGPVWGCCAILRNRDYRRINGFYGIRMSKEIGEEPQLMRKLLMHGKKSGQIIGPRLMKAFP